MCVISQSVRTILPISTKMRFFFWSFYVFPIYFAEFYLYTFVDVDLSEPTERERGLEHRSRVLITTCKRKKWTAEQISTRHRGGSHWDSDANILFVDALARDNTKTRRQ